MISNMYEKFKEDYYTCKDSKKDDYCDDVNCTNCPINEHIKKSYLNAIDVMMNQLKNKKDYLKQIEHPNWNAYYDIIKHLQEQRKLIENYEA